MNETPDETPVVWPEAATIVLRDGERLGLLRGVDLDEAPVQAVGRRLVLALQEDQLAGLQAIQLVQVVELALIVEDGLVGEEGHRVEPRDWRQQRRRAGRNDETPRADAIVAGRVRAGVQRLGLLARRQRQLLTGDRRLHLRVRDRTGGVKAHRGSVQVKES